jgi:hypothetical protein
MNRSLEANSRVARTPAQLPAVSWKPVGRCTETYPGSGKSTPPGFTLRWQQLQEQQQR